MKKVLITGAASGIGNAVKNYFLNKGYFVIGLDIIKMPDEENLDSYVVDITNQEELEKLKNRLKEIILR